MDSQCQKGRRAKKKKTETPTFIAKFQSFQKLLWVERTKKKKKT